MADNKIVVHISAENQDFVNKLHDVVDAIKGAKQQSEGAGAAVGGFTSKLAQMGAILAGGYATLKMMGELVASTIAPIYEYSSAMEQNTVAFETFLGSAELAKKYLGDLQKIAADTPFELPGVTEAGKKLLAFGFDAKQSLQMLRTIGDTAAGLGQGTEGIDRITLALGQIKAKGKVMGDELLQLAEAGIPAYTILADKLGLTSKQVKNIGDAGIDADTAISALLDGMNEKFGGLSQKISDTKQGMMSTIRDNALAMGEFLYRPFDDTLKSMIRRVRDWTNDVADAIRKGDASGAFAAMFPADLVPKEWLQQIKEIKSSVSDLFEEGKALANQFGDDGKQALLGIVDAALDIANGFISVSRAIVQAGNDLLYIFRSILPDGVSEFVTMREVIELAVKSLVGFFVLQKIIKLVQTLRKEYLALKLAMVATSKESAGFFAALSANILKAIKNLRTMKDVVGLLAKAFKLLSRSNIPMMLLSIGLSLVGDKLIDLIEKYFNKDGKNAKKIDTSITDATADARDRDFQDSLGANEYKTAPKKEIDTVDYAAQKKTMDRKLKYIDLYFSNLIDKAESKLREIDSAYSSGGDIAAQAQAASEERYRIAELKYAQAEQKRDLIAGTAFEDEEDKNLKLMEANNNLDKFRRELDAAAKGLQSVANLGERVGRINEEGTTWRREVENVDIEGLDEVALQAISAVSEKFQELTGKQMVVSSGLREWGGHVNGKKFDVVDDATSTLLEDNANGIRDAIIEYAESIGLKVLDEYRDPSARATAGHLDFSAENFKADNVAGGAGIKKIASNLEKYKRDFDKIIQDGERVTRQLAEATGDVSTYSKKEIEAEYGAKTKAFRANGMEEFAESAEKLKNLRIRQVDFSQVEKDIELAYRAAEDKQKEGLNQVAAGTKSALDVANEAADGYSDAVKEAREKLQQLLNIAKDNKWTEFANKISDQLEKINDNILKFYQDSLAELDEELRRKLALIASDSSTTNLQKEDLSDEARREYYEKALAVKKAKREKLIAEDSYNTNAIAQNDFEIAEIQNQLNGLGSTLDKVHEASKQAFEDGLLDFLSRGINQCESLGEAFRSLASTILQEIQRVYAEAMTKSIMSALFPALPGIPGSGKPRPAGVQGPLRPDGSFAEGGSLSSVSPQGEISGPGTGTSDSIFMWADNLRRMVRVSDGEWIMKQKAVNYYGPNIMAAINRGMIPRSILEAHGGFAEGGPLRGAAMTTSGKAGVHGLTADISNSFSPRTNVEVRIDGDEVVKSLEKSIRKIVRDDNWNNAVLNSKIMDKVR